MEKWKCSVCGWIYNSSMGDSSKGVKAGTEWKNISSNWLCPICGAPKEKFEKEKIKYRFFYLYSKSTGILTKFSKKIHIK